MTVGIAIARDRSPQQLLEDFVIRNADLHRLEGLLSKFNLFDALNVRRQEIRHSDFLGYLLDPQRNHGLGDAFLKCFLQVVLQGGSGNVKPVHIDIWSLSSSEVHREWKNIDILVRDETNRLVIIIENKVDSTEHSNQLARYYELVTQEYAGWNIIPIYLTVDRDEPSEKHFIVCGYDRVLLALTSLLDLDRPMPNAEVRLVIEHYAEMLRRHLVSESEIPQL